MGQVSEQAIKILDSLKKMSECFDIGKHTLKAMLYDKETKESKSFGGVFNYYYGSCLSEEFTLSKIQEILDNKAEFYMCLNQTNHKANSYKQSDILIGRSRRVGIDIDHVPSIKLKNKIIEALKKYDLLPAMSVFTKNGVHLHYYCGEGEKYVNRMSKGMKKYVWDYLTVSSYKQLHTGLSLMINDILRKEKLNCMVDPSVCNIAGLLRVPSSNHCKDKDAIVPIGDAVFYEGAACDFRLRVISERIHEYLKANGFKSKKVRDTRIVNQAGNSINPEHFADCKTAFDVLIRIFERWLIRKESMSCRHIAAILFKNGYDDGNKKSAVNKHINDMLARGLITKVKDAVWVKDNPSACRGAEYILNYDPTITYEKYVKPALEAMHDSTNIINACYCEAQATKYMNRIAINEIINHAKAISEPKEKEKYLKNACISRS
jgi:hypothetical protein